ncbi:MAG: sigma factor-like helix-turn-helix DNA-binding protein [Candidatus Moranbacteria bacterium]|nr:sigma factor-like helix-turn-helix DNA-binding protein [Candidatus Moranbacteria bacterium]
MATSNSISSPPKPKEPRGLFSSTLQGLLERLPVRSRSIVEARFGIGNETPKTLEEIGRSYQITRERVRQVIGSALGFLSQEKAHPSIGEVVDSIEHALAENQGVMKADDLLEKLSFQSKKERGALLAFLEALSIVKEEKATKEYEKLYRLKDFSLPDLKKVIDGVKTILKEVGDALEGKALYARFKQVHGDLSEQALYNLLSVSKEIKQSVFGKWGLAGWSDIKPRGTREKAYLVLQTKNTPLHFREIASLIDSYGLQKKKKSHPQTVHNELIKDKRFVLVGRGIYALSDWGYKRGTVKEVITDILRGSKEPLSREAVLARVLKIRQVKKSTVIINLNTFFARIGKNAYTIK